MVDSRANLKITDFGLSISRYNRYFDFYDLSGCDTHQIQTLWYRAPEILLGIKRYSNAIDIWSVGCIIAELFDGEPLFSGDSQIGQIFRIFYIKGTPLDEDWNGVENLPQYMSYFPKFSKRDKIKENIDPTPLNLLEKLLDYDPSKRISPRLALDDKWFEKVEEDLDKQRG